jgi:hypothetical protein
MAENQRVRHHQGFDELLGREPIGADRFRRANRLMIERVNADSGSGGNCDLYGWGISSDLGDIHCCDWSLVS